MATPTGADAMTTGHPTHRIEVREVGLRDGLQIEAPLATADKLRLAAAVVTTGVARVEATAFVSPRAVPAMADAEQVAAGVLELEGPRWSALVASSNGARRAVAAGLTTIEYVVSAAEGHSQANARRSTTEAVAATAEIAELVHESGGRLEVIIATAWDCPFDGSTPPQRTAEVARQVVDLGADELCLGDTIGTTTPARTVALVELVRAVAPGVEVGVHLHDTRGMGMANAWAAVQAGVTRLDASVGGLGGCPYAPGASGNIATEELVYLLEGSGFETGIDLDATLAAAALAQELVGHRLDSDLLRAGRPIRS